MSHFTEQLQRGTAGLFASDASIGAYLAVLMAGMLSAFLCASGASNRTGCNCMSDHGFVVSSLTAGDGAGCNAKVGAIQGEANALNEARDLGCTKTGIRT